MRRPSQLVSRAHQPSCPSGKTHLTRARSSFYRFGKWAGLHSTITHPDPAIRVDTREFPDDTDPRLAFGSQVASSLFEGRYTIYGRRSMGQCMWCFAATLASYKSCKSFHNEAHPMLCCVEIKKKKERETKTCQAIQQAETEKKHSTAPAYSYCKPKSTNKINLSLHFNGY
jgi:hypothetical protein